MYRESTALGKGHFGTVYRGIWHDSREDDGMAYEVAMKSLTPNAAKGERVKLLREAAIMGQFHHPNILQLYGVVVEVDTVTVACHSAIDECAWFCVVICLVLDIINTLYSALYLLNRHLSLLACSKLEISLYT